VTRVLLLWVNNHFTDFEMDKDMMDFIERFEVCLEREKMHGQLRMLNFACAAKARKRILTLTRPSRDEPLQFSVVGGYERGFGIFISRVDKGSKSEEIGMKRGDQILEVNGQSFQHGTTYARAIEILKSVCHLSITVKSNPLAFQEMLQSPDDSHRSRSRGRSAGSRSASSSTVGLSEQNLTLSGSESTLSDGRSGALSPNPYGSSNGQGSRDTTPTPRGKQKEGQQPKTSLASSSKAKINRAFNRFLHKPKSMVSMDTLDDAGALSAAAYPAAHNSMSNPDLLRDAFEECKQTSEYPEHVLKVYKADQTFKYLLVHKETTAHEVVMLSLQEFGITETR
jgi:Rap guanine nucleotide exchange factor 2